MLKSILSFSLRFRGVVLAIASLAILYGTYITMHAKLDVFPEFAPPQVVIQTEARGLSPEQVEALVTQRIEFALNGTAGLESIRSQSIQGLSVVTIVFTEGTDIYRARQMVGERLLEIASAMPNGIGAPTMTPLTSATSTIMSIGLRSAKMSPIELRTFAEWTVRPQLLSVPGVAKVAIYGAGEPQLQIQVLPSRLLAYQMSISEVLAAARQATGVRGAGFVETNNQRVVVRSEGQTLTPELLGNVALRHVDSRSVRLRDVANVLWAPEPPIGGALINGEPGVILLVSSQFGENPLEVSARIDRALSGLTPAFNADRIRVDPALFRAESFISTAVANIRSSLLLGGILVAIVLSLFLYNARTAFISLTAIPLSLLTAIVVLNWLGASLNTLTLGGLAIAIGEVVDDAIIDVENVFRRLRENQLQQKPRPVFGVILDASFEVRSAVVYATFIVALVFLPVLAMSGIQGRIFAPLGWAYILSTMASLGVALTVTPALCFVLLPTAHDHPETEFVRRLKAVHRRLLERAAANSALVIGGAAALCLAAAASLPFFGGTFLPELQERSLVVQMTGAPGTALGESLRIGGRVSLALLRSGFVENISQKAGRAELADDTYGPQQSEFNVNLRALNGEGVSEIRQQLRATFAQFPGFDFSMMSFLTDRIEDILSGTAADVVIRIAGDDLDVLDREARKVAGVLSRVVGSADVRIQAPGGMPQLNVRLLPARLLQFGFRPADVLDAIQAAYQGSNEAQIFQGNRVFNLVVILDAAERRDPEMIKRLMVRNSEGASMPLAGLASIKVEPARYAILHDGTRRVQIISCNVQGRDLTSFVSEAQRRVASQVLLPPGTRLEFAGASEARSRSRQEIILNSIIAMVMVACLLYIALGNLRNLMLVLANIPFALVGGVIAAWASGGWLSLGSMVGFVTLFGITMRNSIMMLSHFEHLVALEGMTWGLDAMMRGASERLLPILMTALVAALGLLPLAIGSGAPGREIEGPMANIILGGLVTSTALNLLVLPSLALRYGRFEGAIQEENEARS